MPVDSVHACIDKNIKKKTVWAPSEWSTIIRNSRINAGPYNTIIFKHTHFLDWSAVSSAMFMKQKLKDSNNDIVRFKSIRRVEFSEQDFDVFKIAYTFKLNEDSYLDLLSVNLNNQNRLRSTTSVINISKPKQLYTSKLPISAQKYKDLRKLCEKKTIPEVYHEEYISLPFKSTIIDQLPETDDDDQSQY